MSAFPPGPARLARARWAVARAIEAPGIPEEPPALPADAFGSSPPGGLFVTLRTRNRRLRGCIGTLRVEGTLEAMIDRAARGAALGDPRFEPVTAEELPDLRVEVSIMTPLEPLRPEDIVTGRHGLMIRHRGRTGLLLPQVATDYGWSRERFLDELCRKAGLPAGAWREPDAELLGFEAEVHVEGEDA